MRIYPPSRTASIVCAVCSGPRAVLQRTGGPSPIQSADVEGDEPGSPPKLLPPSAQQAFLDAAIGERDLMVHNGLWPAEMEGVVP